MIYQEILPSIKLRSAKIQIVLRLRQCIRKERSEVEARQTHGKNCGNHSDLESELLNVSTSLKQEYIDLLECLQYLNVYNSFGRDESMKQNCTK